MFHHAIVVGICAALAAEAAEPPWNTPGACLTPQETPCRTVKWVSTGWENMSWGFHAIRRWRGSAVLAYRRDGAMMDRCTQNVYRNWVFAGPGWDRTQIRFPSAQKTIDVDHSSKEYRVRPVVPGGSPVWDATDSDCTKMALAFSLSGLVQVGEGVVAGIKTVRYTGVRRSKERMDLWLAPSLGCMQMMVITSSHNAFGLPTSYSREEAVFVRIGEPDELLFNAPTGYREIQP